MTTKTCTCAENDAITLLVPTYRSNVRQHCDVAEDILRIYGYNKIDSTQQIRYNVSTPPIVRSEATMQAASNFLSANGFNEIMTLSFNKAQYYNNPQTYPATKLVAVRNPHNSELNVLRQTLLFGGLETIAHNIRHRQCNLRLYEFGNAYSCKANSGSVAERYSEQPLLSILMTGLEQEKNWNNTATASTFFTLKNVVERFLTLFNIDMATMQTTTAPTDIFSDGISYKLMGQPFLEIGIVSTEICMALDIKQDVFFAELRRNILSDYLEKQRIVSTELPKYPEVRRDIAILIDSHTTFEQLRRTAMKTAKQLLKRIVLFDVYEGSTLPAGKKSYAMSFYLQDSTKTLVDSEIDRIVKQLVSVFEKEFGATLR